MTALVRIAPNLRAILTSHVALQLVDWCCLRAADDVERDGLVGVATKAANLKVSKTAVQGVADCRRRLRRPLVAEHPVIPGLTGEPVGLFACRLGALGGHADRRAEKVFPRLGAHGEHAAPAGSESASRYSLRLDVGSAATRGAYLAP